MRAFTAFIVAMLATAFLSGPAVSHSYTHADIAIGHIWAPPQPEEATGAPVFGAFVNRANAPVVLVGADTPIAQAVRFRAKDGESFRWLDTIRLEAGRPTALAPWGAHIWLEGIEGPLVVGDRIPLTLDFGPAGTVEVEVYVEESPSD